MRKNNKTCIVCGAKYTYCSGCADFDHLPRWYGIFDSENCKNIFNAASDYLAGIQSAEQTKSILTNCDLSLKDKFPTSIIKVIEELCPKPVAQKAAKKVVKMRTTKNKAEAE